MSNIINDTQALAGLEKQLQEGIYLIEGKQEEIQEWASNMSSERFNQEIDILNSYKARNQEFQAIINRFKDPLEMA